MEKVRSVKSYAFQEASADQVNSIGDQLVQTFNDFTAGFIMGFQMSDHVIFQDLDVSPGAGLSVDCGLQGLFGLRTDTFDVAIGVYKGIRAAFPDPYTEENLVISPNSSGLERIDTIEVEILYQDDPDFTESVPIFNPGTGQVSANNKIIRKVSEVILSINTGTPGSGTGPAVTAGKMVVKEIIVPNGASSILPGNIISQVVDKSVSPWSLDYGTRLWPSQFEIWDKIGFLTSLDTDDKTSIVNAINDTWTNKIGLLASLNTNVKTSIVNSINDIFKTSTPTTQPTNLPTMYFDIAKSAFRAGNTGAANDWDNSNVGTYSTAFGIDTRATGNYSAAFGQGHTLSGTYSFAAGENNTIDSGGTRSAAFGQDHTLSGTRSFAAGGNNTINIGSNYSAAFGQDLILSDLHCFAAGHNNTIDTGGANSAIFGLNNNLSDAFSFVAGQSNTIHAGGTHSAIFGVSNNLSGAQCFVAGQSNTINAGVTHSAAFGQGHGLNGTHNLIAGSNNFVFVGINYSAAFGLDHTLRSGSSFVAGQSNTIDTGGQYSAAFGKNHTLGGLYGFAAGINNTISTGVDYSAAFGRDHTISDNDSFVAGFNNTINAGGASSALFGQDNTTSNARNYMFGVGHTSINDNVVLFGNYGLVSGANQFLIGNGGLGTPSSSFRIEMATGATYNDAGTYGTGADYAEMFEWKDGNKKDEDRIGYFIAIDGENIRIADKDDSYILGITSGRCTVIGNLGNNWKGKYATDEFGRKIEEKIIIPETKKEIPKLDKDGKAILDKNGKIVMGTVTIPERIEIGYKKNPEWKPDNDKPFVTRDKRKEWAAVGLMGRILVRDDGTCMKNGFCKHSNGGMATKSDSGYRVLQRTGPNIIEVLFR